MLAVLFCTTLLTLKALGQQEDFGDYDYMKLPPLWKSLDEHGHMVPLQNNNSTDKPLIGRPDGHEPTEKPLIGQPDGHEPTEKPLIGRPDGHEPTEKPLIGQPDGHEQTEKPFIGQPDGHEPTEKQLIGQHDGHELTEMPLLGRPDGHEPYDLVAQDHETSDQGLIGKPDGHDWNHVEVPPEPEADYDDEPLVRCKRPLCMMYCSLGFQTDANGCWVCKCLEDPCQAVKCTDGNVCHPVECEDTRSCVKLSAQCIPPSRNCPEPMCANFCPNGYANNEEGCMTCTCNLDPSPPSEIQDDPSACPDVMCANFCPSGYKKNDRGCSTCTCINDTVEETLCGGEVCEVGQICRTVDAKSFCAPKPLCLMAQEMASMKREMMGRTRMFVPECEPDGAFNPRQCNPQQFACWCVDDRGKEVDGTRTPVTYDQEDVQLHCEPNMTSIVYMHMMLNYREALYYYDGEKKDDDDDDDDDDDESDKDDRDDEEEDDDGYVDFLHIFGSHNFSQLEEIISSWLLVERQYVSVTKVERNSTTSFMVQLQVNSWGEVDLPSAVEHMKRKMRMGHCHIPVDKSELDEERYLAPDVDTLNIEHQYNSDANVNSLGSMDDPFNGHGWYKYCFGDYHILLVVATMLLLFMILALFSTIMVHRRRRSHRSLQFRHHKLENQLSHDPSVVKGEVALDGQSESTVVLISADELEKKLPLA